MDWFEIGQGASTTVWNAENDTPSKHATVEKMEIWKHTFQKKGKVREKEKTNKKMLYVDALFPAFYQIISLYHV